MPTYQNNIPQSTDRLTDSQADLLANFAQLQTYLTVNHTGLNNGPITLGKHNLVSFPAQGLQPGFLTNENGLYSFVNPTTTKAEIYAHKQTQAGSNDIPMTASVISANAPARNTPGWSYLPSGILMKWGIITAAGGSGTADLTNTSYGPAYATTCVNVIGTCYNNNTGTFQLTVTAPNTLTLTGTGNIQVYFLALGY